MEEREHQTTQSPEPANPQRISRRRLFKMAATAGGALAGMALLPDSLSGPAVQTVQAHSGPWAPLMQPPPIIAELNVRGCQASFGYVDVLHQVNDATTLMGISTSAGGQLVFQPLSAWSEQIGLTRRGTPALGTIKFGLNGLGFCGVNQTGMNQTGQLHVQLRVCGVTNATRPTPWAPAPVTNATERPSNRLCTPFKPRKG